MRIVNRKELLSLPSGIIYSKYQSLGMFGGLYEKGASWPNDWLFQDLIASVDSKDSGEWTDIMFLAETGTAFKMDLNCSERDGAFEESDMFAIYDKTDLNNLVMRLKRALDQYPEQGE